MSVESLQVTTRFDTEQQYRLLQLTPKLEESLKNGELVLRSGGDSVFVCTQDTTHFMRRLKQSNTLMLTDGRGSELQAFAAPTELLETVETPGSVDWSKVPVYSGNRAPIPPPVAIELSLSQTEFERLSRAKPAVELNGGTYVVSPDVVHDILVDIVSGMVETGDLDLSTGVENIQLQANEPPAVVSAVYNMFSLEDSHQRLDKAKIAQWTGTYILQQHPQGLTIPQFTRIWTQDLPIKMNTRVESLAEAVETKPGVVRYVDRSKLSSEPRTRFAELFRLKQAWLLSEIEPFVLELVPPPQKLENWILKHARKTRKQNDFIISARKL